MADIFVLDTSALITFLQNEDGADRIDQILNALVLPFKKSDPKRSAVRKSH